MTRTARPLLRLSSEDHQVAIEATADQRHRAKHQDKTRPIQSSRDYTGASILYKSSAIDEMIRGSG